MKKFLCVFLSVCMAFCFVGCGSDEQKYSLQVVSVSNYNAANREEALRYYVSSVHRIMAEWRDMSQQYITMHGGNTENAEKINEAERSLAVSQSLLYAVQARRALVEMPVPDIDEAKKYGESALNYLNTVIESGKEYTSSQSDTFGFVKKIVKSFWNTDTTEDAKQKFLEYDKKMVERFSR